MPPIRTSLRGVGRGDGELQAEGKIRFAGIPNVTVDQLEEARGIVDMVSVRTASTSPIAIPSGPRRCEELGICFFLCFPLAAGDLAEPGGAAAEVAAAPGAGTGQIALAWLLRRSPAIVPIPGTSSFTITRRTSPRARSSSTTRTSSGSAPPE